MSNGIEERIMRVKQMYMAVGVLLVVAVAGGCGGRSGGLAASAETGRVTGYINGLVAKAASRSASALPAGYAPVEGATVTCSGVSDTTDANGFYELDNVPAGPQTCTATKANLGQLTFNVEVIAEQTVVATGQESTETAFEPQTTGTLVVTSSPPGASIIISGVTLEDTTDVTLLLAPGAYSVLVSLSGYQTPATKTVTIEESATATAPFGALQPAVTQIAVTPATLSFTAAADTSQLSATCTYTGGGTGDCTSAVTWSSSNGSVATVNSAGLVTSAGDGSASVSASSDGVDSNSVSVSVDLPDTLTAISLSPASISNFVVGDTSTITASCTFSKSGQAQCPTLTWSSDDTGVATVDSSGVVTAVAAGDAVVSASADGIDSNDVSVSVATNPLTSISVSPASVTNLDISATATITPTCTFAIGGQGQCPALTWTSADTQVATVDSSGIVTGVSGGDTTVKAGYGEIESDSVSINVNSPPSASITAPEDYDIYAQTADIQFSGDGSDAEDDTGVLAFLWTSDLDGTISTTAAFTKYNLSVGTHEIVFSVTDTGGLTTTDSITLVITENNPPVPEITSPDDGSSYNETADILFTGSATDPETGTSGLTYSWSSDIDGPMGGSAVLQYSQLTQGTHTITLTATDRGDVDGQASITVIITPNTAPTAGIASPADGSQYDETENINFIGTASDNEENQAELTYSWASDIDGEFGTAIVDTEDSLSAGTHTITFTVTDSGELSDSAAISVVVGSNTAPTAVISSPTDGSSFNQTQTITFNATASSDEQDSAVALGYEWVSDIDSTIGTAITFTRDDLSVGTHSITLTVTDSGGLTDQASVTVTINTNTPPDVTIDQPADGASFNQTDNITFQCSTDDAEDTIMSTYAWSSSIDGSFGGSLPIVQNDSLSAGSHTITITVTDSGGLQASDSIQLFIDSNTAPTASITSPADGSSYSESTAITFQGSAGDAEDGVLGLTYDWTSSIDGSFSTLLIAPLVGSLSTGTHTIVFTATDSGALSASDTIEIYITADQ